MTVIRRTAEFDKWFQGIRDVVFIKQFDSRIQRIEQGNFGLHKRLGEYLYELKFATGKGYRIYYTMYEDVVILWGGVKDGQSRDIKKANIILQQYKE